MGEIIRICILNIQAVGGASGLTGIPRNTTFAWVFWIMIITLFFLKNMINSTYGRSCISVRENAIAAAAMGINTTFAKVLAFAIGAFFAGLAGGSSPITSPSPIRRPSPFSIPTTTSPW